MPRCPIYHILCYLVSVHSCTSHHSEYNLVQCMLGACSYFSSLVKQSDLLQPQHTHAGSIFCLIEHPKLRGGSFLLGETVYFCQIPSWESTYGIIASCHTWSLGDTLWQRTICSLTYSLWWAEFRGVAYSCHLGDQPTVLPCSSL